MFLWALQILLLASGILTNSIDYQLKCDLSPAKYDNLTDAGFRVEQVYASEKCVSSLKSSETLTTARKYWDEVFCLNHHFFKDASSKTLLPALQSIIRDVLASQWNGENIFQLSNFVGSTKIPEGFDFLIFELESYGSSFRIDTFLLFDIGYNIGESVGTNSSTFRKLPLVAQRVLTAFGSRYYKLQSSKTQKFLTFKATGNSSDLTATVEQTAATSEAFWSFIHFPPKEEYGTKHGYFLIKNKKLDGEEENYLKMPKYDGMEKEIFVLTIVGNSSVKITKNWPSALCLAEIEGELILFDDEGMDEDCTEWKLVE